MAREVHQHVDAVVTDQLRCVLVRLSFQHSPASEQRPDARSQVVFLGDGRISEQFEVPGVEEMQDALDEIADRVRPEIAGHQSHAKSPALEVNGSDG